MKLLELRLSDLRLFDRLHITFAPGLNVLSGANGSGKTTVLEGVAYALFGAEPYRSADAPQLAVRDGARSFAVDLTFEQAGQIYRVVRKRSRQSAEVSLSRGDRKIAEGDDVDAQLAQLLRISEPRHLPLLLQRLVGIPQGELTTACSLEPDARRAHFEPLLNLDRYGLAAARLTEACEPFRRRSAELAEERARAEGEGRGYHGVSRRLELCRSERTTAAERLAAAEAELEESAARLTELQSAAHEAETQKVERAVLLEGLRGLEGQVDRARQQLADAEAASATVESNRGAYARWEELEAECRAFEMRRAEHGDVRSDVARLEERLLDGRTAVEVERDGLEASLEGNQAETEQILGQRDALRSQLESQRAQTRRAEGAQGALGVALARVARVESAIAGIAADAPAASDATADLEERAERAQREAARAASRALEAEIEALRARSATRDEALARQREAEGTVARLRPLLAEVTAHLRAVTHQHGACPLLKEPCSNIGGDSLIDRFATERDQLLASIEAAEEGAQLAATRAREAEAATAELTQKESALRAARRARPATPSSKQRPADSSQLRHQLDFNDIGHQLSGLAGVIGALDGQHGADPVEPVALLGAVAGEGELGPIPSARLELPSLATIESAYELAQTGSQMLRERPSADRTERIHELSIELARRLRELQQAVVASHTGMSSMLTRLRARSQAAEDGLLQSSRRLEQLAQERARIRAKSKALSSDDLRLLETETSLSERRMQLGTFERLDADLKSRRAEQSKLREAHDALQEHIHVAQRVEVFRDEWKRLVLDQQSGAARLRQIEQSLQDLGGRNPERGLAELQSRREQAQLEIGSAREADRALSREAVLLEERLAELEDSRQRLQAIEQTRERAEQGQRLAETLATMFRSMTRPVADAIRADVSAEADRLYRQVAAGPARLAWGDDFSLTLTDKDQPRQFSQLARGDQTAAALALQLALLAQFPHVGLLLLDEPSAHLDRRRRFALAETLARYLEAAGGYLEQVLVVTHDDAFDHVASRCTRLPSRLPGAEDDR